MAFLDKLQEYFGTTDLYTAIGSTRIANLSQLKKAYYKSSLSIHPDRCAEADKVHATEKFKLLSKAYSILSDKDKRILYDETGVVDEENVDSEKNWEQYWRILFKKVSLTDIEKFEEEYKGSAEEKSDVKQAYIDGKGSMEYIIDSVMCAKVDDEERFTKMINSFIKKGEVESYNSFTKETKKKKEARKRKALQEANEAEKEKKRLGLGDSDDALKQMILSKNKSREQEMDSFLDSLAQKYGGSKRNKK